MLFSSNNVITALIISLSLGTAVNASVGNKAAQKIAYMKHPYPALHAYVLGNGDLEIPKLKDFRRLLYQTWKNRDIGTFITIKMLCNTHFDALKLSHPTMQVFLEEMLSSIDPSADYLNVFIRDGSCNQFGFISALIKILQKPFNEIARTKWKSSLIIDENFMNSLKSNCQVTFDDLNDLSTLIQEHGSRITPAGFKEALSPLDYNVILGIRTLSAREARKSAFNRAAKILALWRTEFRDLLPAFVDKPAEVNGLNVINYAISNSPTNKKIYFTNQQPGQAMLPEGYEVEMAEDYLAITFGDKESATCLMDGSGEILLSEAGKKFGIQITERNQDGHIDILYDSLWGNSIYDKNDTFQTKKDHEVIIFIGTRGGSKSCLKKFAGDSMVFGDRSDMALTIFNAFKKCSAEDGTNLFLSSILYFHQEPQKK